LPELDVDHAYGILNYIEELTYLRLKPEAIVLSRATPFWFLKDTLKG